MGLSNHIRDMLIQKAKQTRTPININFELLPSCNLSCKMCYVRYDYDEVLKMGGLLSIEQWLSIAKEFKEMGSLFLLLTGGEVFTYPHFKELYIKLYEMGFIITINTNATLINEEIVEWLKQYPPKCMSISLYGSSNAVYEDLCSRKNMFDKVNHAINLLKQNHIAIECKTMLTPFNLHDLKNMYEYVKQLDIPYEVATYSFPAIRNNKKQIRFTPEELVNATIYRNQMMNTKEANIYQMKEFINKYEQTKNIPGTIACGLTCSACSTSCWINWKGEMIPCALMITPFEKPLKKGVKQSYEDLKDKVDQIVLSKECSYCEYRQICTVCPASAYAETRSYQGTSLYHCEVTKKTLNKLIELLKQEEI